MNALSRIVAGACLCVAGCGDDGGSVTASVGTTVAAGSTSTTAGTALGSESAGSADTTEGAPVVCGTGSASALAQCVDAAAIEQDVGFIADIRTPGSVHWLAVQELCADRLTMLGYTIEMHEYATGTNVIGRMAGTDTPDELVLVGAHYDHIPNCLGADDNATGVAGILEAARVLATADQRPRSVAIACWDEEELGLIGSSAWVGSGQDPAQTVVAYFNYDMIGYASDEPDSQAIPLGFDAIFPGPYGLVRDNDFRGDFILMAADEYAATAAEAYEAHAAAVGLVPITAMLDAASKNSDLFSDLRRSDHAPFWRADIPAIFLTDTGEFRNEAYHCGGAEDTVARLDFDFARRVVMATVGAAAESAGIER